MTGAGRRPQFRPQTQTRRSFGRCHSFPTTQVCLVAVLRRQLPRWFILLLLCSTVLHPLPPLMMVKQDLFHWVTGKRGSGEDFMCVSVCVINVERHSTYGPTMRGWIVIVCMNASFVCLCLKERSRERIGPVDR